MKIFLFLFSLAIMPDLFADSPGKKKMSVSKVSFQDVNTMPDYDLYWQLDDDTNKVMVRSDSSLIIPSSGGAPYNATFWAVNKKTGQTTDSIHFENYYAPDYVIILDSVMNGKLNYQKRELSNANKTSNGDTTGIKNKALIKEADVTRTDHNTKLTILAITSVVALTAIVFFFVHRKNQRKKRERSKDDLV